MEILNCIVIVLCMVPQIFATSKGCYYGFCEEVENYPYELVNELIRNSDFQRFFTTPSSKENYIDNNKNDNVNFRKDNYVRKRREIDNCTVRTIGLYPRVGKNIKGEKSTIINTGEFSQFIRYTECLESYCKAKFKIVKLATIDKNDNNTIYMEKFRIPSDCRLEGNNHVVS